MERTQREKSGTRAPDGLEVVVTSGPSKGRRREVGVLCGIGTADDNDLPLEDPRVSRHHAVLQLDSHGVVVRDEGSTNGTWLGGARITSAIVPPGTVFRVGRSHLRIDDVTGASGFVADSSGTQRLIGRSEPIRQLRADIEQIAGSDTTVLIIGESGSGKELVASAIHERSARARGPFVTLDCAALPPNLVESELFGHEKGAFTGATRRHEGAFERADGGTLFLDEVGELPPGTQAALLGALERRQFRRVGGSDPIRVDVRVLAATNRELATEVDAGTFRRDLYFRIAVVTLRVPSLRSRPEDVAVLVRHFARMEGVDADRLDALFGTEAIETLSRHDWPGNVRELRNVVLATIALGRTELPERMSRPPALEGGLDTASFVGLGYKEGRAAWVSEFERAFAKFWLDKCDGNISKASREAGIDRSYLTQLVKRHGLR